jgi:putative salt-induced outer membrane protein
MFSTSNTDVSIVQKSATAAALAFVLIAGGARAQDAGQEEEPVTGKAALGYLATSGNTESTNVNASFNLVYQLPDWRHGFDLSAVSASSNDETTAEAYRASYEARRDFGEHNYFFSALNWRLDRFSGYAEQVSQTVGYGRRLIDRESHVLAASAGTGARQAELRDGSEEDGAIVRGSLDYIWTMSPTAEFEQTLAIESGSTNTSVEALSALRARMLGNISLVLSYRVKHNSNVPPETANADRFSSLALEYAF